MSTFGGINTTAAIGSVSNAPRCELATTVDQAAVGNLQFGASFATEVYKTHAEMHTAGLPDNLAGVTPRIGATYVVGCALLVASNGTALVTPNILSMPDNTLVVIQTLDRDGKDATFYPTWLTFETDWLLTASDQSFGIYANAASTTIKAGSRFWIYRVA